MTTEYGDRALAETNEILRTLVGSEVHGTNLPGTDDHDEMGIFVQPKEYVLGLATFEQYVYRTQDEGVRSGHGDTDLTIYSLRKWVRLAAAGNPSVLLPLFVSDESTYIETPVGALLRAHSPLFWHRQAAARFLGYLDAQRQKMLGLRGNRTNRPELVALHGFDTKFAMHAVRLGHQGVEFMETGRITLPLAEPYRSMLLELRRGELPVTWALDRISAYEAELLRLRADQSIPERADAAAIDRLLITLHELHWMGATP